MFIWNIKLTKIANFILNMVNGNITSQDKTARLYQHVSNGKQFIDLETLFTDLTRNQVHSIEQFFIENGPNKLNKINSISPNNGFYKNALDWASKYIGGK